MLTIALTGGIACGKTTVSAMLHALGAAVIDADEISRALTAANGPALPAIHAAFGDGVFHPDGTLDRPVLSQRVFGHPDALQTLNAITHPLIECEIRAQLQHCRENADPVVVLDVPLLFEANMQHLGDIIACVTVPEEVQIARLKSRNGFDRETALARIRSQMPVAEKAARSHVVIHADQPLPALEQTVRTLYQGWLAAARKENA